MPQNNNIVYCKLTYSSSELVIPLPTPLLYPPFGYAAVIHMCNQRHEQFSSTVLITFSPAETFCLDTVERGRGVVEEAGGGGLVTLNFLPIQFLFFFACLSLLFSIVCLFVLWALLMCFMCSIPNPPKSPFSLPPLSLSLPFVVLICFVILLPVVFFLLFVLIWFGFWFWFRCWFCFRRFSFAFPPFWFRFGFGFEFIFLLSSRYSSRWCKFPLDYVYKSIWLMRSQLGTNFVALQFLLCLLLLSSLKNNKLFKFSQRDKISGFIVA